jgi:hypothetical protein
VSSANIHPPLSPPLELHGMMNFNLIKTVYIYQRLGSLERDKPAPALPSVSPAPNPQQMGGILGTNFSLADLGRNFGSIDISDRDRDLANALLKDISDLANDLGLDATQHRIMLFSTSLGFKMKPEDFTTEVRVLRETLTGEVGKCMFYHYPPDKLRTMMGFFPSWKRIIEAFPETKAEALAAIDLYALGHNTGSVFHSMRVAEHGLRALAKERKVTLPRNKPLEWGTWQEIINQLDDFAKTITHKARAGKAKDDALSFYSGALADLSGFKDEYRNQVMHVRKLYDERHALRAYTKVHAFMERLSEKIDHKHHSVRWGLKFSP